MTEKHTPAPWDSYIGLGGVSKKGIKYPLKVCEDRQPNESWLDMRKRIEPELKANGEEAAANERLATAAPELLEALESYQKIIPTLREVPELVALELAKTYAEADALLKKIKED